MNQRGFSTNRFNFQTNLDPKKTQEELDKVTKLKREIDSEFKVLTDIYNHNLRILPENGEKINAQTKKFNEVKNEVTKIDEASER